MKVLICDATDPKALKIIEEAGIEVVNQPDITPEELLEVIAEFPCMVVRSRTKVTKEVIDAGISLKSIVRAGVGLDNIDEKSPSVFLQLNRSDVTGFHYRRLSERSMTLDNISI